MDGLFELRQLPHHLFVDLQPPGGVEDHHAIPLFPRLLDAVLRDPHDVLRVALDVDRDVELGAECLELVDGGRAVDVRRDHSRGTALAQELPRELGRGRGFARSLEAHHHHDRRRDGAELEPLFPLAQHCDQLVVHDLHELLRGRHRLEGRDAGGRFLDTLDELARQLEVDVRFQQDPAYFAESVLDVGRCQDAPPAQTGERRFQLLAQLIEHSPQT